MQVQFGLSTEMMGVTASASYAGELVATLIGSTISGVVGPRLPAIPRGPAAAMGIMIISAAALTCLCAAALGPRSEVYTMADSAAGVPTRSQSTADPA